MADLDAWLIRFEELGLPYSRQPDSERWGATAIIRDPDNIQVELHCPRRS